MFLGSYTPAFDRESRRVALPKKIRAYLATGDVILSWGFERCLFGFDLASWEKESKKQLDSPITERSSRDLRRFFFSTAQQLKLDDQGRFVIPGSHLEYAQIKKPVIVGAGDHFEIWDEVIWTKELSKLGRVKQ